MKPGDHPEFFRFPAPEGRSRESTIRLDAEGRFFYEGDAVSHPGLAAALATWVSRHPDDGRYILTNGYDWTYFTVEDAPYQVRAVRVEAGRVVLELSDGTEEAWEPETTRVGAGDALYARVKAGAKGGPYEAKFSRHAQQGALAGAGGAGWAGGRGDRGGGAGGRGVRWVASHRSDLWLATDRNDAARGLMTRRVYERCEPPCEVDKASRHARKAPCEVDKASRQARKAPCEVDARGAPSRAQGALRGRRGAPSRAQGALRGRQGVPSRAQGALRGRRGAPSRAQGALRGRRRGRSLSRSASPRPRDLCARSLVPFEAPMTRLSSLRVIVPNRATSIRDRVPPPCVS